MLNNPPAKRLSGFAEYLQEKGLQVKVITGIPNYPEGKLLKGYSWFNCLFGKKEIINKVDVYRFPEIPLKSEGVIKRLINYLSFAFSSSLFSFPLVMWSDIVIISSPPIFSAIPMFYISKLFGKKVILDIRDLWPESTIEVVGGKKGFAYNLLFKIINHMYKKTESITCVTYEMKKQLVSYGVDESKINVIYNFASKQKTIKDYQIKDIRELNSENIKFIKPNFKLVLAYTGILTNIQGLDKILVANNNPRVKSITEWHIMGSGDEFDKLVELCKSNHFDNVIFYGQRSKEQCNELIKICDIGIVPLVEKDLFKMALPSKMMEYTSYGKPVIANWSQEVKSILQQHDAGYFIENLDDKENNYIETICNLTRSEVKRKAYNAIKLFDELFERNNNCDKLYKIVEDIENDKNKN
jgi:glycosyltransferase involved in cell wall biosynthesis